jgi:hypothetical protein
MANFLRRPLMVFVLTIGLLSVNAQISFWKDADVSSFTTSENQSRTIKPSKFRSLTVDTAALKAALQTAPTEFTTAATTNPLVLSFPMPDGSVSKFAIVYSPIMEPGLAAQFPNIRTYSGQGIDDKTATLKMDWTDFGLHVQVLSPNEASTFYVDPYVRGEKTQYISYHRKDLPTGNRQFIEAGVLTEQMNNLSGLAQRATAGICLGTQLRAYRLAVACTGEYAAAVGATTVPLALSAVTTTVNRVDGIYETELSVRLTLIANETSILFTDATSDPFTGNSNANTLINESQTVITNNIGSANYDIGHTFSTGAGGLAGLGVVCNSSQKARGVTGSPSPVGDAYDVDYVAHEMGHEFGGNHTFNAVTSNCGGGNRNSGTSVEPGSGITIMAYAGICTTNNLAPHSIPYFHAISTNEIGTYISSGVGSFCGTVTNTGNSIPVVNAGTNYTIPASTPFMLTGSATDANTNEVLTYSWEETDLGPFGADWNSGFAPYFRSFSPTLSKTRYFPQLSDIINNTTTIGEILPTSSQTLNFRLTARDNRVNGSGVCSADMQVTVNAGAGPFQVTSQTANDVWTANGSNTATITWNVANTNAAPINTSNVSILFSTDGGQTFPYTLLSSTANDGTETIVIPSLKTTKGRIMVKGVGNIFFNINSSNVTVNTSCGAEGAIIAPATTVSALYGTANLNLALSPQYATPLTATGTLSSGDPATTTSINNIAAPSCISTGGVFRYDLYPFTVSVTGSYTFTHNGALGTLTNLYTNSFDPTNPCTNYVASNATYNGTSVSAAGSVTVSLTAGVNYVMAVGTYSASQPTLPSNYNIVVTTGSGGAAYAGSGVYQNPGAGFTYTYVIVNNSNGNIVSIGSSNLTNSTTFPIGQYTVYGLNYSNTIANLNSYIGGNLTALLTQIANNPGTFCADLSKNSVTVNVTGTYPVKFTVLKARKQGEKVSLDWGTHTEQNSSQFIIQRSANASEFSSEIGKVKAAGNSTTELKYNFLDVNPIKGWNYYRINQVDIDGRFTYSNVAAVNFEKGGGRMVIYPNPAKDQLNVEYTSERSGKLDLQVIDSKGSVLMAEKMNITTGRNGRSLNISFLSTGMYLLKYIDGDGNISFSKFVKQ